MGAWIPMVAVEVAQNSWIPEIQERNVVRIWDGWRWRREKGGGWVPGLCTLDIPWDKESWGRRSNLGKEKTRSSLWICWVWGALETSWRRCRGGRCVYEFDLRRKLENFMCESLAHRLLKLREKMKSFRESSGDIWKIILMSLPGLHIDQLLRPPPTPPLTLRLRCSHTGADPQTVLEGSWIMQFAECTGWLSWYPRSLFLTPPFQTPSGLSHCLGNGISTQPKVQGPLQLCLSLPLQSYCRLLPSTSCLLEPSSLSPPLPPLVSPRLPCLCSLELRSPPHLFPAHRLFPYPPGSRSSPIFPEASPTPIRPRILLFLWRISSLNDLYVSFCI